MDLARSQIRMKHYSIRTEQAHTQWIRRFILFRNKRHPEEMGVPEVSFFLTRYRPACKNDPVQLPFSGQFESRGWSLNDGLTRIVQLIVSRVFRAASGGSAMVLSNPDKQDLEGSPITSEFSGC